MKKRGSELTAAEHGDRANHSTDLLQLVTGYWISQAVYVAAKLGIADVLARGPKSAAELARLVRADADALGRLLRALASVGVLEEIDAGRFRLTPRGRALRADVPGSIRAAAILFGEPWYWQPWTELLYSVKSGRPAWNRAHGMGQFEYLKHNRRAGKIFDAAMTDLTAQLHTAAIAAYDFSRFRRVIDVGGGHGALLAMILRANPAADGILFDQPHVISGARRQFRAAGLMARSACVKGDFFQSVPGGGDAYVLAHILHDWDDSRAGVILRNIRSAMAPNGRVLILEQIIPPGNGAHFGKWMDITMLVVLGGRERTVEQFEALLAGAGLRLSNVVATESAISVIEAEAA